MSLAGTEFLVEENNLIIPTKDQELYYEAGYLALKALLYSLCDTMQKLMLASFDSILKDKEVAQHISDGIMQYIHAAAFLSFASREINKENISAVVRSLGLVPDERMIDILISSGARSHLIYVYAYYLLVASGKEVNEANICMVVESVGIVPEAKRVGDVLSLINK